MRLAMAILVAVTQLLGSWLCCCGPARVAAALAGADLCCSAPEPSHCPLCAQAEPRPQPKKKPTEPAKCPCGGVEFVALPPALKAEDLPAADVLVWGPVALELPDLFRPNSVTPADVPGRRMIPTLTTSDRLYCHHVLRC